MMLVLQPVSTSTSTGEPFILTVVRGSLLPLKMVKSVSRSGPLQLKLSPFGVEFIEFTWSEARFWRGAQNRDRFCWELELVLGRVEFVDLQTEAKWLGLSHVRQFFLNAGQRSRCGYWPPQFAQRVLSTFDCLPLPTVALLAWLVDWVWGRCLS